MALPIQRSGKRVSEAVPGGFLYAGLVPLQARFPSRKITNYRWCRTVCRLITHSPPVFGESTTSVTVAETADIMRPQAAIRLRSQKLGALGHLSSCCKVMIPDSARRAFLSPAASRWEWPTKRLIFDRRLTIVFEWKLGFVVEKCIERLERAVLK